MKTYVVVNPFVINGWFEEPLYDDAPSMGTYTRSAEFLAKKYSLLDISDDGEVIMPDTSYGVSMHGSVFRGMLTPDVIRTCCVEADDNLVEQVVKYQNMKAQFDEASALQQDMEFLFDRTLRELKSKGTPLSSLGSGWSALSGMLHSSFAAERFRMEMNQEKGLLSRMLKEVGQCPTMAAMLS